MAASPSRVVTTIASGGAANADAPTTATATHRQRRPISPAYAFCGTFGAQWRFFHRRNTAPAARTIRTIASTGR